MLRSSWLLGTLLALLTISGCAERGGTVKGRVTLEGSPVADADVIFAPKEGQRLRSNQARTDANGNFAVQPDPQTRQTLLPGKYEVLISKYVKKDGSLPKEEEDPENLRAAGELLNAVPDKYSQPGQSGFVVDIQKGENNLPAFDLKKKP